MILFAFHICWLKVTISKPSLNICSSIFEFLSLIYAYTHLVVQQQWRPTCDHTGEFHIAGFGYCLGFDGSLKTWLSLFCQLRHDSTKCTPEHGKPYKLTFTSQGICDVNVQVFFKPLSIGVTTNHDKIYFKMGGRGGIWG